MISAEFVNATELRKEIGNLNKSGALKEKIKAVGVTKEDLHKAFLAGIEACPEGSEEEKKIPQSCFLLYNKIVEGTDPSPEEQAKLKAARSSAKKDAAPRGPSNEGAALDIYTKGMAAGQSQEEIKKATDAYFRPRYLAGNKDDAFIQKRVDIYFGIAKKQWEKANGIVPEKTTKAAPTAETPVAEKAAETAEAAAEVAEKAAEVAQETAPKAAPRAGRAPKK